jgi:UDP:flavonoid glycosyltransferase YjiC (YdhE family)
LGDVHAGWIPLDVVVSTCDLIVHHSGGVTAMTGLNAGVPQLLIPKSPYSIGPSRRISDYGAAITLLPEDATADRVAGACREILSDPSYAKRAGALACENAALRLPADVVGDLEELVTK